MKTQARQVVSAILGACALALSAMAGALEVGDKAPDFELQASDGNTYRLSDFAGKQPVILAFFPAAFTGGCTIQCKAIRDSRDEIQRFDVAYFMASVDSVAKNTDFAAEYELDFPVLADPDKTMTADYGVLGASGFANRWTYYIDAQGIVVQIDKSTNPSSAGRDLARSMAELGFPQRPQTAAR